MWLMSKRYLLATYAKNRWRETEAGFTHVIIPLLVFVGIFMVSTYFYVANHNSKAPQTVAAATSSTPTCNKATGPFIDKADQVVQGNGTAYIPYGITVSGLAHSDYQDFAANDSNEIQAGATSWCVNTIRLQVGQDDLVGTNGTTYSAAFMTAVQAEVKQAESLGLAVVINAQTQDYGGELAPTSNTVAFWKDMSSTFAADPQVIFDIFNEPHNLAGTSGTTEWKDWQNGATVNSVKYIGMQQLSNDIRADGAKNLLWIEGPDMAQTLSSVSAYPISGVGSIMYAIHHPLGAHNTTTWNTDFGYLINNDVAPVVVGEWTNYASNKGECWTDAPTTVPEFLSYLQSHKIGMTAWTLESGVLAQSSDLTVPTRIQSNWACVDNINGTGSPNEGAGNQIMNWYIRQNS